MIDAQLEEQLEKESYFETMDLLIEILKDSNIDLDDLENMNKDALFLLNAFVVIVEQFYRYIFFYQEGLNDDLFFPSWKRSYQFNPNYFYYDINIKDIQKYFLGA